MVENVIQKWVKYGLKNWWISGLKIRKVVEKLVKKIGGTDGWKSERETD